MSTFFYHKNIIMTPFLNYITATLRALFAWHGSYDSEYLVVNKGYCRILLLSY